MVISAFAILILSVIGSLYRSGHHEFAGGKEDADPKVLGEVASTIFIAVIVYAVRYPDVAHICVRKLELTPKKGFLVFCGLQGMLHVRESRRGAIALH